MKPENEEKNTTYLLTLAEREEKKVHFYFIRV